MHFAHFSKLCPYPLPTVSLWPPLGPRYVHVGGTVHPWEWMNGEKAENSSVLATQWLERRSQSWWACVLVLWTPYLVGRGMIRRRSGHQWSPRCGAKGGSPGFSGLGVGLHRPHEDFYTTPINLGLAKFLFLRMFLLGDGRAGL